MLRLLEADSSRELGFSPCLYLDMCISEFEQAQVQTQWLVLPRDLQWKHVFHAKKQPVTPKMHAYILTRQSHFMWKLECWLKYPPYLSLKTLVFVIYLMIYLMSFNICLVFLWVWIYNHVCVLPIMIFAITDLKVIPHQAM